MESLDFVNRVVALTNVERSKLGLSPLSFDSQLSLAAQEHSVDMAVNDYFAHLTIAQGTGINAANTLISTNGELLALLTGIGANTITNADFFTM